MKKFIFLFVLVLPLIASAQRMEHNQPREKLPAEQRATLHAKKMQLALALSESQTERLIEIFKKNQRPERPKKKEDITSEERYEMYLKQIDHQIAIQKEVKEVLNENQFATWEKMNHSKKPRMAHRGKNQHTQRKKKRRELDKNN
ncbi:hypothetical protein N9313_04340 [Flavobacteriaceae bacterium]|nr:hypothetical protein [Flavobacteriaceae bacterium]